MIMQCIISIINNWDPIGLFVSHVPFDEYTDEAKKIIEFYVCSEELINKYTLGEKIHEVFCESFGIDSFDKSIDECIMVAESILETI